MSDPTTGICLLWASVAGKTPADSGHSSQVEVPAAASQQEASGPPDPCSYVVASPQPAAADPVWAGHTSADGSIWLQVCRRPDGFGSGDRVQLLFFANGTGVPAGPPIDPRVLAQEAIAAMVMTAPQIHTAPPSGSSSAVVGLPVWMWVDRGEHTTGPTQQSASAGGVTVTAVGQVSEVRWDMGDGHVVDCGAGTPYTPGAVGPSPDCGYTYATASTRHAAGGRPWPISATATWTITWTGGGQSGSQSLELSSTSALAVTDLNVLNQDGADR